MIISLKFFYLKKAVMYALLIYVSVMQLIIIFTIKNIHKSMEFFVNIRLGYTYMSETTNEQHLLI